MKRLRIAVIGGGHLGRIHARLLKENRHAKVIAVCDPQPRAQQSIIADLDLRACSDYQKIIDEFDAAVIATPSASHAEIALHLIQAGKHLLIEKPITVTSADARRIAEAASENQICVQVGHVERFNAAIRFALEHVGQPRYIEAVRMSGFTYRSTDIGVVHDLMIHDIDLAQSLFQSPVRETRSSGIAVLGHQEDIAEARLNFACGGVANLRASRCSYENERSLKIFGTQGFAAIDLAKHSVSLVRVPQWIQQRQVDFLDLPLPQQSFVRENLFSQVLEKEICQIEPVNAIAAEQQDWLEAIATERNPLVTADQAARNVEIAEQIIDQINHHSWSRMDDGMIGALATPSSKIAAAVPPMFQNAGNFRSPEDIRKVA
jgi:predicted dehydrogenase